MKEYHELDTIKLIVHKEINIKRRDSVDIIAEILETATNGANKTRIVYSSNIDFTLAKNMYL